jgi:hypothetical protein|tara:strand:+ start:3392 stop:3835 length:444 start_codon:yes stop_codon:yes gene_type:complete
MNEVKKKLDSLSDAYTAKKVEDEREEITVFNEKNPYYSQMKDIQRELADKFREIDYEIMDSACMVLSDVEDKALEEADTYELSNDTASVYNNTRLSYMDIWNQDEVSDIVKELDCDISTACAVWYEQEVARACEMLRSWVLNENESA